MDFDEKFIEIEAKLIRQEHRLIPLITNYIFRKSKWNKDDKRRNASTQAIIWRIFFSPPVIAIAAGGMFGILSIIFLWQQNTLIASQNDLFENQNKLISDQISQSEAARISSQVFIMGSVLSDVNAELNSPKNFNRTLSDPLVGRIISLSFAMKPYHFVQSRFNIEGDDISRNRLSPERGQFLMSLARSGIEADFFENRILSRCIFHRADLQGIYLDSISLAGVDLRFSDLSTSNLTNLNFEDAVLAGVDFKESNLTNSSFQHANLFNSDMRKAVLDNTDFRNVEQMNFMIVDRIDWIEFIKDSLKLRGAEEIHRLYEVESMEYEYEFGSFKEHFLLQPKL